MAWTETSKTAWGNMTVKVGATGLDGSLSASLEVLGNIKEDSIRYEVQDGTTKEWKAVGGTLIDSFEGEPTLRISMRVKNLNLKVLERFWEVKENQGKVSVIKLRKSSDLSLVLEPDTTGTEVTSFPKTKAKANIAYSESEGYGLDVTFTVISAGAGKPLFEITAKA